MPRNGFTLVELSIVLVIIGLLIGGILAAQSMVSTARVTRFIGSVQEFDVAVINFKDKYKDLPGDTLKLGPIADNDGFVEDHYASCCSPPTIFRSEVLNFWPHLQVSGFKIKGINNNMAIATTAAGAAISIAPGSQNVPMMELGANTGVIPYSTGADYVVTDRPFGSGTVQIVEDLPRSNFYFFADFSPMANSTISSGGNSTRNWRESIPVDAAQAIDSKMDDGKINSGKVLNASYYNTGCSVSTTNSGYNVSSSTPCALAIKMQTY